MNLPTVIVTGGAGFIGSAVCRYLVSNQIANVINVDVLTYAANLTSVEPVAHADNYTFVKADICDAEAMQQVFEKYQPDGVMHLAAESHVDRSITGAQKFIETNVLGTSVLLDAALKHWRGLDKEKADTFKFLLVSTDEVYGSLGADGLFEEVTPYDPSSPYSASKAASDHLAIAWHRTYGLPVVISNCSNNYGPYHFPEKLIPLIILNALHHKPLPIYGDGSNVRDWLFVDDHAKALWTILKTGELGEKYNVGGRNERTNLEVVQTVCRLLDDMVDSTPEGGHESLITYVTDRPGHDARYAIDATKLENELGWKAEENFDTGIKATVQWYLENESWWRPILEQKYAGERLGL
ncbi:dTDP-glucose 4,6-dehydratase [Rubritalea marina]|uniref:dTDP-glucose 4,6-dehydratase n=1 Tax=Rubritalea marina TaxID=361055 RepID=UPI0003779202|nr:dTDP-glucose 4,6-dehydratase [Rubritalea marina]